MIKCWFCGEAEATEKIRDPNKEQEMDNPLEAPLVDVCWDCKMFVQWAKIEMVTRVMGYPLKPFPEWLFEKEGVYPKNSTYLSAVLTKKKVDPDVTK